MTYIKFKIGDIVYLRTDIDQYARYVTGIMTRETGIAYEVSFGTETSFHYGFELNKERDIIKTTSN